MKLKNNSFLATATKTSNNSSLLKAVASGATITPLMPGYTGKNSYISFLTNFGSEYKTAKQARLLEAEVKKYLTLTNQTTEVGDLNTFVKYANNLKKSGSTSGEEMHLSSGHKLKLKTKRAVDLSPYRLYAMYWADRLIDEHNKRVDAAYNLQEKYPSDYSYSPSKIDIAKFNVNTGGLTRITSSELYNYMEGERKLYLRSSEDFYVYKTLIDNNKLDLIYNHDTYGRGAADKFGNRYDLFLHNLLYSAEEAGWDEAINLIKWCIENGYGDLLYDVYTSDPDYAIVFEYRDTLDDSSSAQKNFINALTDAINKVINNGGK